MAKELKSLLNLNYLDLTNKTHKVGKYDLPSVKCPAIYDIDYIALYKELRNYQKTPKTVISFYQFDKEFDATIISKKRKPEVCNTANCRCFTFCYIGKTASWITPDNG